MTLTLDHRSPAGRSGSPSRRISSRAPLRWPVYRVPAEQNRCTKKLAEIFPPLGSGTSGPLVGFSTPPRGSLRPGHGGHRRGSRSNPNAGWSFASARWQDFAAVLHGRPQSLAQPPGVKLPMRRSNFWSPAVHDPPKLQPGCIGALKVVAVRAFPTPPSLRRRSSFRRRLAGRIIWTAVLARRAPGRGASSSDAEGSRPSPVLVSRSRPATLSEPSEP